MKGFNSLSRRSASSYWMSDEDGDASAARRTTATVKNVPSRNVIGRGRRVWSTGRLALPAPPRACEQPARPIAEHAIGKTSHWVVHATGKPKAGRRVPARASAGTRASARAGRALARRGTTYLSRTRIPADPNARNNIVARRPRARRPRPAECAARTARPLRAAQAARRVGRVPGAEARARVLSLADQSAFEPQSKPQSDPAPTNIWLFIGDKDTNFGNQGAVELARATVAYNVPTKQIHAAWIPRRFTADHIRSKRLEPAGEARDLGPC